MARFYSNENFPLPVVLELRRLGHDIVTSFEAGRANLRITDDAVIAFATEDLRAVLTLNRRDFIKLHFINPRHSGIVVCTVDADYVAMARRISLKVAEYTSMTNELIRVNRE